MEYKGYTVTQSSYNNHVMISKDGQMVSHINCSEKKSEEELKEMTDFILELREEAKNVYLNDDGSDDLD